MPTTAPNFDPIDPRTIRRARPLIRALRRYHRHQVVGLHRVPRTGPLLMALNHSLATYDGMLLGAALIEECGRVPSGLGDDMIFRTPGLRRGASALGVVPASHENGERLLGAGRLVFVAPGGMREALRPGDERYTVRWDRRKGFVRLALRTGAPIQLAACPNADRLYHVYDNDLTKVVYRALRAPLPLVRGWGPTLLPRPVQLVHLLSEPLHPEPADPERLDQQVDDWHASLVGRMQVLMDEARRLAP